MNRWLWGRGLLGGLLVSTCVSASSAMAADHECTVERKFDSERMYTAEQLKQGQFSTRVEETKTQTFVSRCSYASTEGKVTCDRYLVDKVEVDVAQGIKKLYVFRSQYNLQIFSGLTFVEDNGRGTISYGKCRMVVP